MNIDFKKGNGLVPVVVQDNNTLQVLMLGYMNEEAYQKTLEAKFVTFYSRSKERKPRCSRQKRHRLSPACR